MSVPVHRICAVCAVRVRTLNGPGFLIIKRKGAPVPDGWALPGGWVEYNETIESAAQREVREETGIEIDYPRVAYTDLADEGFPLVFCFSPGTIDVSGLTLNIPNEEVSNWDIARDPRELCFSTHITFLRFCLMNDRG